MVTFDELVNKKLKQEPKQEEHSEHQESPKKEAEVVEKVITVSPDNKELDDLGCIICELLEQFGLGAEHMNLPGKALMSMFGGDADIIITMGGPDEVYKADNIKKVLKGARGKINRQDIKAMRHSEKAEDLKDLLAMFGDDAIGKIVKMKMFQEGGRVAQREGFEEWAQNIPDRFKGDDFDLRAAYQYLPQEQLEAWKYAVTSKTPDLYLSHRDKDGRFPYHLKSIVPLGNGEYMFLKKGTETTNPEVHYETDLYYNGDNGLKDTHDLVYENDRYYYRLKKAKKHAQGGEVSTVEETEKKFATGGQLENLSKITAKIGKNEYTLYEAKTPEEREKGLQGVKDMDVSEGMIFYFDKPQKLQFWMQDTEIPLQLAFFNEDFECIAIKQGKPLSEDLIECDDAQFVVELHPEADVQLNDELDLPGDDDEYVMQVLAPDGSIQMELKSGERIFSRKSTLTIIKKVKRALKMQKKDPLHYENYVRQVGKYVFKELDAQDNRDPEYVELDKKD